MRTAQRMMGRLPEQNARRDFGPARSVGDYELTHPVALDALGETWVGHVSAGQEEGRQVLVTILDRNTVSASPGRLRKAAATALSFRHPQVLASLEELGESGELFLVSEYMEGEPLSTLLAAAGASSAPFSQGVVLRILIDTLDALASVACRGLELEYGAISPEMVFVCAHGDCVLRNPSVASVASSLLSFQTHPASLPYRAPEQVRGQQANATSDVFSIGVLMWEMLSGYGLFGPRSLQHLGWRRSSVGSERAQITQAVLNRAVPNLNEVHRAGGQVHPQICAVVERCLQRRVEDRFADLSELKGALLALPRGLISDSSEVAAAVERLAGEVIGERRRRTTLEPSSVAPSSLPSDRVTAYPGSEANTAVRIPRSASVPSLASAPPIAPPPRNLSRTGGPSDSTAPMSVPALLGVGERPVETFEATEASTAKGPQSRRELVSPPRQTAITIPPSSGLELEQHTAMTRSVVEARQEHARTARRPYPLFYIALGLASLFCGGGFAYAKGILPLPFLGTRGGDVEKPKEDHETTSAPDQETSRPARKPAPAVLVEEEPNRAEDNQEGTTEPSDLDSAADTADQPGKKPLLKKLGKTPHAPEARTPAKKKPGSRLYRPSGI